MCETVKVTKKAGERAKKVKSKMFASTQAVIVPEYSFRLYVSNLFGVAFYFFVFFLAHLFHFMGRSYLFPKVNRL